MTQISLRLDFESKQNSLISVEVEHNLYSNPVQVIGRRGRTDWRNPKYFSFPWSRAVMAFCTIMVGHHFFRAKSEFILSGRRPSFASSFDDCLCKGPIWLQDMFGLDIKGVPLAKKLFLVHNSGGKLPIDTQIYLNPKIVDYLNIEVKIDGNAAATGELKALLINWSRHSSNPEAQYNRNSTFCMAQAA